MTNESICALFCDTQLLDLEPTSFIKTPLKQYLPCLPECLFIQTISTIFKDYNSLLMLQSSLFNVNTTNKITKFIGFIKLACRFG